MSALPSRPEMLVSRVKNQVREIRSALWFRPAATCLLAVVVTLMIALLDGTIPKEGWAAIPIIEPQTVTDLLHLLAGGMLTVATVTLSVLIVTLSIASGQASPRTVPELMADSTTQNALSVFLATFVFAVSALSLLGAGMIAAAGSTIVFGLSLVAAAASISFLVRWIHHVADSIKVNSIVRRVYRQSHRALEDYLERAERAGERDEDAKDVAAAGEPVAVRPSISGFVQFIDAARISELAEDCGFTVSVTVREGDFVHPELTIMEAGGLDAEDEERTRLLRATVVLGAERTSVGDPLLGFELLAEIACRALSPGINDPQSALICLDYLGALLARAGQAEPATYERACRSRERVQLVRIGFQDMLERALRPVSREGADTAEVLFKAIRVLSTLVPTVCPEHLDHLRDEAERIREYGEKALVLARDREALDAAFDALNEEIEERTG